MNEQKTILLVDDSADNLMLMREALGMAKCIHPLQAVQNGEEAIEYLNGGGPYSDRDKFPMPAVILLDLNMPKIDGFGVLSWVRAQPVIKRLTIIIMTASMRDKDVKCAFDLGASGFLVKPIHLETLAEMMRCLCQWIQINQFPLLNDAGGK
jgi:CheY-like chemotaxis protein